MAKTKKVAKRASKKTSKKKATKKRVAKKRVTKRTKRSATPTVRYPEVDPQDNIIIPIEASATPRFAYAQLFIAAINNGGQLVYTNQTEPNGPFAKQWTPINSKTYELVDAGSTLDGRVAIITTDAETGAVQYIAERPATSKASSRWLNAENLGLPSGTSAFKTIAFARGVDGLDNVFGSTSLNTKKSIWWKYRNPPVIVTKKIKIVPPGAKTPITVTVQETQPPARAWSDWIDITGNLNGGLKSLRAASNADGRIVLSGVYFNGIPWISQQTSDSPFLPEAWSNWETPGDGKVEGAAQIEPILDQQGTVSAFVSSSDGLLRSRQTTPGGAAWDHWSMPGLIQDNVAHFASSKDGNNHLALAVLNSVQPGRYNYVYFSQQTNTKYNQWTTWQVISMVTASELEMTYNADGSLALFAFDPSKGALSVLTQINSDSTEWYRFWTPLGTGIKSFSLTRDLTSNNA